ncbi:GTF3C2 family protein [Megaselia abdita]
MSSGEKSTKKTIKKVTVLNKELFENAGIQLAAALEKLKKEKPESSMTKEVPPPTKPNSKEIKQLLKRKVEERIVQPTSTVPPPAVEIKKEIVKPTRRRPEPAKVQRKTAAARQKAQQQVRVPIEVVPEEFSPESAPLHENQQKIVENSPKPIIKQEKTPLKNPKTVVPEMRSPSIEMVSPAPSSSADENIVLSPPKVPNDFYQFPPQSQYIDSSQEIHPINISYTGNDPVLKNIPNTMILPMVMEQSYEQVPETFDEATRESLYSNEVNEDGEDGVNFLNNMFAGISNQNSNDYSSTDDEEEGEIQHFGEEYGEDDFYDNSRGVEYTIHEIEESKPARPIILEEKILADNEKFSADWVDKIVKTEVKTEPEGYNFYTQQEQHALTHQEVIPPIAHTSKSVVEEVDVNVAPIEEPEPMIPPPSPVIEEPISQASSRSEEVPMDQDSEEPPSTPSEEMSQDIPMKEAKAGPSRIRRNKPKVNLIQRNKPNLPAQRKTKPQQSKNLTTQIMEEPPPQQSYQPAPEPTKNAVTPSIITGSFANNPKPSFFENSEISPHRKKKVDTIDLTDPDDELPLIRKPRLEVPVIPSTSKKKETPKRKKAVQANTITKYLSPPDKKKNKSYDSEEELPGFEFDSSKNQQPPPASYNFVIIENPPLEKPHDISHNSEDEIPETFDLSTPIPNLRRTEPTPPPLGNIRAKRDNNKGKRINKKTQPSTTPNTSVISPLNTGKYNKLTKTIHPYLLLITNRKDLANQPEEFKPVEVVECKPGTLQCGFCGQLAYSNEWIEHLGTHYGVGWKAGEPVENVSSYSYVLQKIITYFKTNKIIQLVCRICQKKYKSGLGMLSHLETCGLDKVERMINCCYCKKNVSKVYISCHLRVCNVLFDINLKAKMEAINTVKAGKEMVLGNSGRIKRTSMIRAEDNLKVEVEEFDPDLFIKFPVLPRKGIYNKWKQDLKQKFAAKCYFKGCNFRSMNINYMKAHVNGCTAISTLPFNCLKCSFSNEAIELVREHIVKNHRDEPIMPDDSDVSIHSEESDDDVSSGVDENEGGMEDESMVEEQVIPKKKKTPAKEKPAVAPDVTPSKSNKPVENKYRKLVDLPRTHDVVSVVEKYTFQFFRTHYSTATIYKNFAPHYFVSGSKIDPYFPRHEHSMYFSDIPITKHFNKFLGESKRPDQEWMQLERFQGISLSNGEKLLFIGGPVSAIAWVPMSDVTTMQYIAVAYRKNINDYTLQKNPPPQKTMILILEQTTTLEEPPRVLYGFKIEHGPVHHLEFMPSGGYSRSMNRLGLLAVSTAETDVHVYSLPIACNIKMEKGEDNFCDTPIDFKFLEILPSFTLVVDARKNFELSHEKNNQCMCIKWSKGKNHNIIAAGFANGAIAIWDIDEDPENLSRIYTNSSLKYVPSCYLAHMRNHIVGLDFHYDEHGPRWLAVCGVTRVLCVYDIDDLSLPKLICSDVSFNIMSSMEWPFIWELFCYSSSDWFAT